MWYCPGCGKQCRDEFAFCERCGTGKPASGPVKRTAGSGNKRPWIVTVAIIVIIVSVAAIIAVVVLEMKKAPEDVEIVFMGSEISELPLTVGDEAEIKAVLTPRNSVAVVEWDTSDKDVVKIRVDENTCTIIAKGAGQAEITACCGDIEKTVDITVLPEGAQAGYDQSGMTAGGYELPEQQGAQTGEDTQVSVPLSTPEPTPGATSEPSLAPTPVVRTISLTRLKATEDSDAGNGADIAVGAWKDFLGNSYPDSTRFWVIEASGFSNFEYIKYQLGHNYDLLRGTLALDTDTKSGGNCRFEFYGDDDLIYTSGDITADYSEYFEIDVSQYSYLTVKCITNASVYSYGIISAELTYTE